MSENHKKNDLISLMQKLDFYIHDLAYINGIECVGKLMNDSNEIIFWPLENEGSGFTRLFKGSIRKLFEGKA